MNKEVAGFSEKTGLFDKIIRKIFNLLSFFHFSSSKEYWEKRYKTKGNSGEGSYGKSALFKATVINSFVEKNKIEEVIEFGFGDGNQLSLFKIKNYLGLDVSDTAVKLCEKKFENDSCKQFRLYTTGSVDKLIDKKTFDMAMSLDVIFHLVEDEVFEGYMRDLFSCAKYVLIFATDLEEKRYIKGAHYRNRKVSDYIKENFSDWQLIEEYADELKRNPPHVCMIYKKTI